MQKYYKILNRKSMRKFIISALEKEQELCSARCFSERDVEDFLLKVWSVKKYGIISVTMVAGGVPSKYGYSAAYTSYISLDIGIERWVLSAGRKPAVPLPGRYWKCKIICKKSFDKRLERQIWRTYCAYYF